MGRGQSKAGGSGGGIPQGNEKKAFAPSNEKVKTFTSVPKDGWEYPDDNGETARWFKENTNSEDLIKLVANDGGLRSSFFRWYTGDYMDGSIYTKPFKKLSAQEQEDRRNFDRILDQSEAKKAFTVARLSTASACLTSRL